MTGEQALSHSSRNSFSFYSQRQGLDNVQPHIPTLSVFSGRLGHRLSSAGCDSPEEADNTAGTGLSQLSPRSLCNKPQDFTITTRRHWESHKVTNLLAHLQKLFMQALCSWKFSYHQSGYSSMCHHTSPLLPARAVWGGHSRSKATDTIPPST